MLYLRRRGAHRVIGLFPARWTTRPGCGSPFPTAGKIIPVGQTAFCSKERNVMRLNTDAVGLQRSLAIQLKCRSGLGHERLYFQFGRPVIE